MAELHNTKEYGIWAQDCLLLVLEQYSIMFHALNEEAGRAQKLINRITNCVTVIHQLSKVNAKLPEPISR